MICCVAFNGAIAFHILEQVVAPPADKPDLWRVLNNLICMCFFMLMSVLIHFKMKAEQNRYSEGQKISYFKKHESDKVRPEFVGKVLNL
jgi:hypothetical protein